MNQKHLKDMARLKKRNSECFKSIERLSQDKPKASTTVTLRVSADDWEYLVSAVNETEITPNFVVSKLVKDYVTWLRVQRGA